MVNDGLLLQLNAFLFTTLVNKCPVLSGNMRAHIDNIQVAPDEYQITIKAPQYDITQWEKTRQIIYTGGDDYALDVERYGGFNTFNSSRHWVSRAIKNSVSVIGGTVGAIIIFQGQMFI